MKSSIVGWARRLCPRGLLGLSTKIALCALSFSPFSTVTRGHGEAVPTLPFCYRISFINHAMLITPSRKLFRHEMWFIVIERCKKNSTRLPNRNPFCGVGTILIFNFWNQILTENLKSVPRRLGLGRQRMGV